MLRKLFMSALFVLAPVLSYAATGDVLFNCTFDGVGSTPSEVVANSGGRPTSSINSAASIVTGGRDGKKAIRYYYPNTGGEVISSFSTPTLNKQEVTVDYWEKFDVDGSASTIWNVKSIRPYVGPSGNDYMAAIISRHNGAKWYQSTWGTATLTTTSAVNSVNTGSAYCQGSGTTYLCNKGRQEVGFAKPWGTSWHNVRVYIKVPSSSTAADGATKVWVDGELIYSLTKVTKSSFWSSGWVPYTTSIMFHPSDDFFRGVSGNKFAFYHFYDDIKVYEGYVPPTASQISPPTGLKVTSAIP